MVPRSTPSPGDACLACLHNVLFLSLPQDVIAQVIPGISPLPTAFECELTAVCVWGGLFVQKLCLSEKPFERLFCVVIMHQYPKKKRLNLFMSHTVTSAHYLQPT